MVDVRRKLMWLLECSDGKEVISKLMRTPMAGESKLNLVSIGQMTNEQKVVMVQKGKLHRTHREAKNDGFPPKYIRGVLEKYKDVLTNKLHIATIPNSL
jgi:hypothetical protein